MSEESEKSRSKAAPSQKDEKSFAKPDHMVLPPKKTYTIDCMRVRDGTRSRDNNHQTANRNVFQSNEDQLLDSCGAAIQDTNSDEDSDMPINLSIKTEPTSAADMVLDKNKNNNISANFAESAHNRFALGCSSEYPGRSNDAVYPVPGYVIPGTEPLHIAVANHQYGINSSQESTQSTSSQPTSGSSQESSQSALNFAMYAEDEDFRHHDFRHLVRTKWQYHVMFNFIIKVQRIIFILTAVLCVCSCISCTVELHAMFKHQAISSLSASTENLSDIMCMQCVFEYDVYEADMIM